jgi:hypothetical protein
VTVVGVKIKSVINKTKEWNKKHNKERDKSLTAYKTGKKGKPTKTLKRSLYTFPFLYYPTLGKFIISPQKKRHDVMAWIRTSDLTV